MIESDCESDFSFCFEGFLGVFLCDESVFGRHGAHLVSLWWSLLVLILDHGDRLISRSGSRYTHRAFWGSMMLSEQNSRPICFSCSQQHGDIVFVHTKTLEHPTPDMDNTLAPCVLFLQSTCGSASRSETYNRSEVTWKIKS